MLFNEVYGSYFHVVGAILKEAVQHTLTGPRLNAIVQQKAFSESVLTIPAALREKWPLLLEDWTTPLRHTPSMPLTTLQKRWLKTLLQDRRIALFHPDLTGLESVEPLFNMDDVVYFDQYLDGDPYEDPAYITTFHQLLTAIRAHQSVRLRFRSHTGTFKTILCVPYRLEYSNKDDKFRVLARSCQNRYTVNLARIERCELLDTPPLTAYKKPRMRTLTFRLLDRRNALERVLLHFSHFQKETLKRSEDVYEVTLRYYPEDETELLIRILSFGPMIHVLSPDRFIKLVRKRLQKQASCGLL